MSENDHSAVAAGENDTTAASPQRQAATPGPWTVETQWASDVDDNQFPFAHWIAGPEGEQIAEQILEKPDAHLIAAAPDLLEALTKAHYELNEIRARDGVPYTHQGIQASVDERYFSSVVDECRAAIAKAEGKP